MKNDGPRFNIGIVRALAVIALRSILVLGVVSLAIGISDWLVPDHGRPGSVVWSQQNFTSRNDLGKWLEARGSSYRSWAKRHPSLASVFESSDAPVAAQTTKHRPYLLLGALATGIALLLLVAVRSPRSRYRRRDWVPRNLLTRTSFTPALATVRAGASFVAQAGSASSPYLRSVSRVGRQSFMDIQDALATPQGRRTMRVIMLYTAYVIFAIALGASVAIYFP